MTVKNLKIIKIDKDKNQILILGAVPGSRGDAFGDKGLKIMETNVYNQKGEKVSEIKLSDTVFNLPWNSDLVHQVVVAMTANTRSPWAHTKTRGEVSGGGRKPWRQKGFGQSQTRLHSVSHMGGRRCCPRTEKRQRLFRKNQHQSQEKSFLYCLVPKIERQ